MQIVESLSSVKLGGIDSEILMVSLLQQSAFAASSQYFPGVFIQIPESWVLLLQLKVSALFTLVGPKLLI